MKTRYKILIFGMSVVIFYMSLVPITVSCMKTTDSDCFILRELTNITRPVVFVNGWDDTSCYSSTGEPCIIEEPTTIDLIESNVSFMVFIMIIIGIIFGIILIDKKRLVSKKNQ